MQHEEHLPKKGFGTNTNGLGILIVAAVAVILALFCWNFWKDGSKEIEHYRLTTAPAHAEGSGQEEAEKPAMTEPSKESSTMETPKADTAAKAAAADAGSKTADSTKH